MSAPDSSELHARLNEAVGNLTYRRLGQLTETHPETVRRYMHGQSPSTDFLARLCDVLSINANWLLTGLGPMRTTEIASHALRTASGEELLQALSHNAAGLRDRLDQMDARMLKLEQRMRSLVTEETAQPGARNQAHDPVPNLKRGGVRTGETAG